MKKLCGSFVLFVLISMLMVACGAGGGVPSSPGSPSNNVTTPIPTSTSTPSPTTTASTPSPTSSPGNVSNSVGLAATTFAKDSITIKKGESVTLVNQTATVHIISNGTWNGNTPAPKAEPGAPVVSNLMFSTDKQSHTIGPFDQTGTFHYYCTVHPGMNLTVIVQ